MKKMIKKAFTLIELLVVIVIIGILATISTATYRSYIQDARNSKLLVELSESVTDVLALRTLFEGEGGNSEDLMKAEFDLIDKVIVLAREKEEKTLLEIINNGGCADCICRGESFSGVLSTGASTCVATWDMLTTLFNTVTDIDISFLETDPWGSPYLIDQNEGETPGNYCRHDNIFSAGPDQFHQVNVLTETALGDGFEQHVSFYDTNQCPS